MKNFIALVSGLIFGVGLAVSGMTDTQKVQGFLDLFGAWDYSLGLVMASALAIAFPASRLIRGKAPFCAAEFSLPTSTNIDAPLLLGGALFGVGWGLYGYCPGPAISAIAYGKAEAVVFVAMMLIGMFLAEPLVAKKVIKGGEGV
jgi:uncharacterized membrane protein YedE/YeeE